MGVAANTHRMAEGVFSKTNALVANSNSLIFGLWLKKSPAISAGKIMSPAKTIVANIAAYFIAVYIDSFTLSYFSAP